METASLLRNVNIIYADFYAKFQFLGFDAVFFEIANFVQLQGARKVIVDTV